jgi:periplasmic copper chaperone A
VKIPWPAVAAATLVGAAGAAGLIRAAMPVSAGGSAASIEVTNAWVRPPAPPNHAAAAYFTVHNPTGHADRLVSVTADVGASAVLHTAQMSLNAGGVVIPAHGRLVLSTGHGHVMIQRVRTPLKPGGTVELQLRFAHAGEVSATARVIALGAPDPTGGHR